MHLLPEANSFDSLPYGLTISNSAPFQPRMGRFVNNRRSNELGSGALIKNEPDVDLAHVQFRVVSTHGDVVQQPYNDPIEIAEGAVVAMRIVSLDERQRRCHSINYLFRFAGSAQNTYPKSVDNPAGRHSHKDLRKQPIA